MDFGENLLEVVRVLRRIDKKLALISGSYVDGVDRFYPWHRLHPARQRQVLAVRDFLTENKSRTVKFAAKMTFRRVPNGYPNWQALASHCYRIGISRYAGRMPD